MKGTKKKLVEMILDGIFLGEIIPLSTRTYILL